MLLSLVFYLLIQVKATQQHHSCLLEKGGHPRAAVWPRCPHQARKTSLGLSFWSLFQRTDWHLPPLCSWKTLALKYMN